MVATPTHLFVQTVTVKRPTFAADAGGSPVSTFGNSLTGVACRIQPMRGNELVLYGAKRGQRGVRIFTAGGQDILEKDRIVYVDAAGTTRTYDVIAVRDLDELGSIITVDALETL